MTGRQKLRQRHAEHLARQEAGKAVVPHEVRVKLAPPSPAAPPEKTETVVAERIMERVAREWLERALLAGGGELGRVHQRDHGCELAIDSREKRQAIAAIGLQPYNLGVTPNATHDQEWRQEVAWSYPGILAGAGGPPVTVTNDEKYIMRHTGRMTMARPQHPMVKLQLAGGL